METTKYCSVRFFGDFEICACDGRVAELPTRYCEALLALLVLNRREGMGRSEMAEILWPRVAESRRLANLRQTLLRLRQVLGSDSISASRSHCRLSAGFELRNDLEDVTLRREGPFLPRFTGEWVESLRERFSSEELEDDECLTLRTLNISDHFYEFVHCLCMYDPNRALGVLKENLAFVRALSNDQLRRIVAGLSGASEKCGWLHYLTACITDSTKCLSKKQRLFQACLGLAQKRGDRVLAVQCCSNLAVNFVWNGQVGLAREYARHGLEISRQSLNRDLEGTASSIAFLVALHAGERGLAQEMATRAVCLFTQPMNSYAVESLRQYYSTVLGQAFKGQVSLEKIEQFGAQSGHTSVRWHAAATRANLALTDSQGAGSIPILLNSCEMADRIGNGLFTIFAQEALARGYARAKMQPEAQRSVDSVKRLRASMGLKLSIWDGIVSA